MQRLAVPALLAAALALFLMLEWIGGSTYPLDIAAVRAAGPWREAHPQITEAIVLYTHLGSGIALLAITAAGAAWLWRKRNMRGALFLVLTVAVGRIGIEAVKLMVDRARPDLEVHPVAVHSQSFPSGHAGNAMLTFVALALFLAPERWRPTAITAAVIAALAMGATRPLLGVHWPSDVLAGWIYGLAVAVIGWRWFKRGGRSAA